LQKQSFLCKLKRGVIEVSGNMNFSQMTRAEKEQKYWIVTSIVSLLIGLAVIASFLFVIEKPFGTKYPADHYYLIYIAITAFGMTILGVMKYFRMDDNNKAWYRSVISFLEINMWIALITVVIVITGIILTYLIML
jgi:ABC-type Fe3+-siderophore transport system permease subunit